MSTGGSVGFAIVLLGVMVGIMVAQPEIDRALEDIREARSGLTEEISALKGTDISIEAVHNNTTGEMLLSVINIGSETIVVSDLDLLVDGTIRPASEVSDPTLYPGMEIDVRLKNVSRPSSVRAVGPYGITAQLGSGSIVYR